MLTHLDSPVDGVNTASLQIFQSLLCAHDLECALQGQTERPLVGSISAHLQHMTWSVRGKSSLMSALLAYMPLEQFLSSNEGLFEHMLQCMATNYLVPVATDLFRAILLKIK